MQIFYKLIITHLLFIFLLSSCDYNSNTGYTAAENTNTSNKINQNFIDPCSIALSPLISVKANSAGHNPRDDIARYQKAVIRSNKPVPYLEHLGWAFISTARSSYDPGFYKLAEQTARCIESKKTNSAEALLLRGHVLHTLHKFKEAEIVAHNLVEQRGLWLDYALLGDVLMEQGQLDNAILAYQEMLDQRPGPQSYSRAAQIRWLKGDLNGAIEIMDMAVKAQSIRDRESAAWSQSRLAELLLQAGKIKLAESIIERALEIQPNYPPALLLKGRRYLVNNNLALAIETLTRAAQINPLPDYQWALIEALRAANKIELANKIETKLARRGAMEDPRTFSLYLTTVGKDIQLALQLAKIELEKRADVITYDTLAWALNATGNIQEARKYSVLALTEGTQDARLLLHAGIIALAVGEKQQAAVLLNKVNSIQHMLLPSERNRFLKEFETIQSQIPMSKTDQLIHRNKPTI